MLSVLSQAQNWSNIISPSRATDWSGDGAQVVNRTTQCGATIAPYTGSAAAINNALNACAAGQFVQLGAGKFTLSTGIEHGKSNVTLRGMGADQTQLFISGTQSDGCHIGLNTTVRMCTGIQSGIGVDSPDHTANWTAGYAQGTTVVTLSNTTGMVAGPLGTGTTLWLDQQDDAADGYPSAGDIFICDAQTSGCANNGSGEAYARTLRGQTEGHLVTAINGNQVTIDPPIRMPNFRASQNPGAWWNNSATVLVGASIENLTLDFSPAGGASGIGIINCTNCWLKGLRVIVNNSSAPGELYHVFVVNGYHNTYRDSYLWGPNQQANAQYTFGLHVMSDSLIENNILQHNVSPIIPNSDFFGNVVGYNFVTDSYYSGPGVIEHGVANMNLYEGNNEANMAGDIIHASHHFETYFRNLHDGRQNNPQNMEESAGFPLYSKNRFFNLIGNVIGDTKYTTYETDQAHNTNAIYEFGWQGTGSGTPVPNDPNVQRTAMRWGNFDTVTGTARFVSSEVPSGISNYPNSVPANHTLPASFYLSSKPSWFGSIPFPPIGPDVSSGNVSYAGFAGHANKIPARSCFEAASGDPAYSGTSPQVRTFNADSCYGPGGNGPAPPDGLTAVVN